MHQTFHEDHIQYLLTHGESDLYTEDNIDSTIELFEYVSFPKATFVIKETEVYLLNEFEDVLDTCIPLPHTPTLKPQSAKLKYVQLDSDDTYTIIISLSLTPAQEENLIGVILKHCSVIVWLLETLRYQSFSLFCIEYFLKKMQNLLVSLNAN